MTSVIVTPLQPPFKNDVMHFDFHGFGKTLSVSKRDGERILALFAGAPIGRQVVLGPSPLAGDDERIEVSVLQ